MNANVDELIKALSSGAVLINNLTINVTNNTADTIVNGDGATVNRITAPASVQRPLMLNGTDYRYSHCAPLDPAVADWYEAMRSNDLKQARSKFAQEYAAECEAHWSNRG